MLKHLSLLFISVFITINLCAQSSTYSRVKIFIDGHELNELSRLGIDISEGEFRKGYSFTSDFSDKEIERIQQAGFKTEIVIADVKQYYKDQNKKKETEKTTQVNVAGCGVSAPDYTVPANFSYGSMGGYFTLAEMLALLDDMVAQYPNLITVKQPIGATTTIESRDIYYVKISDNPNLNEPEPKVLYTALHHAREPEGLSQLIFYMYYLLENYMTDPDVQSLVQNTEMFFVPCVNPDGYIENETTDPAGGGMWRKNKRDNLDGTFGVDLNRNYGFNWGYDDTGSSPFTGDGTYRGTSPFSEPETQLLSDFAIAHQFKLAFNYHTCSNLLIYPWGYDINIYTPDSLLYSNYGELLTRYNGYRFGTGNQTVNYIVNGSSDDWMYGEQTVKPKLFAMTPEVGEPMFGFWPPTSEIIRLCKDNMFSNLTLARLAGKYAIAEDASPSYFTTTNGYLKFNLKVLGLDTTGTFTVSIYPGNAAYNGSGNSPVYSNLSTLQVINDSIAYSLNTVSPGDEIKYILVVYNGAYNVYSDTITKYFGNPSVVLNDAGNNMNNWSVAGSQWGVDNSRFYSAGSSISDSPLGNSTLGTNALTLAGQINLSNALRAMLTFYTRWEIENTYDYAQLLISTDNGLSWTPLCGKYTHPSNNFNIQGEPVYDGFHTPWVKEEINLDNYIGQNIKLRFEMTEDGFTQYDGFFFDDLQVNILTPVGINELQNGIAFVGDAMPNPSSETTSIPYTLQSDITLSAIEIYNPLLQKIFSQPLADVSGQVTLDVSKWNSGV